MTPIVPDAPGVFEDPRSRSDFHAPDYPTINTRPAPSIDASGHNDRIALEFLLAYYNINRVYRRLLDIRRQSDSAEKRDLERECLQSVEQSLKTRDLLEDYYAPFGVVAEPLVKSGFTVDVALSFGNVDATGQPRSNWFTLTAFVPIPLPDGLDLKVTERPVISKE